MSVNKLNFSIDPTNSTYINRILGVIGMMFAPALYLGSLFHTLILMASL